MVAISSFIFRPPMKPLPYCTSDRSACFDYVNKCDPTGWECGANNVFSKTLDNSPLQSSESKVLECYSFFHCDINNENFKGCINSKKNGITIENICSNSTITSEDGCVHITFPDGTGMSRCE